MAHLGNNGALLGPRRISTVNNASGLWSLDEHKIAKLAGIWPEIQEIDPYWDNVSLLLKMEDANGETSFTDSSANALTMTSTAVVTTTQYRFGTRSADFQSGSKVIESPASSLFNLPGDFTIEMWARWSANPNPSTGYYLKTLFTLGNYTDGILFRDDGLYVNGDSIYSDIGLDNDNDWHHYAVSRSGSSLKAFKDGTSFVTVTQSGTLNSASGSLQLGRSQHATGSEYWVGQIDEVRITKGICRYTANFTPRTAPFPSIGPDPVDPYWADVALLLHLDGTNGSSSFPDSSPDNRSTSGSEYTTLSTTDPKFGTASAYFGNTITITPYISLGTGDFTIECFLFPDAFGRTVFARTDECFFVFMSPDTVRFACPGVGWVWLDSPQLSVPLQLNAWSHFALCKSGTTLRLFINGTLAATKVNFLPSDVPIDWFGVSTSSSVYYNYAPWLGRMDEIRVTRAARYTSDFTPPTAPFPSIGPEPVINPIPALAPVLWYDFADEATVTTSGTEITAVTSKGSRDWTLTKSTTGPQYVTGINGKKCLDWGASPSHPNFMYNSDTTSTTIGEVYVVVDASFGGYAGNYAGLFTSYSNDWYVLVYASSIAESGTGFNQLFVNGGTASLYSSGLFASPSIDNPAIVRIKNSSGTPFNTTGGFEIGNDRGNSSLNRGWCGLIGEYIVFPSVLNSTDRAKVENYLSEKWGISLAA